MKKVYEEPSVKKVEFEFNERIAASGCTIHDSAMSYADSGIPACKS